MALSIESRNATDAANGVKPSARMRRHPSSSMWISMPTYLSPILDCVVVVVVRDVAC